MLFSIGQVSKMYNMSHDTLRYYDKIGLVKPSVKKDNGYRYYSMKELELLDLVSLCKKLDMSIKDIKEMIEEENINKYTEVLKDYEEILEKKINQLNVLKEKVRISKETSINMKDYENKNIANSIYIEIINKEVIFVSQTDDTYIGNLTKYKNLMFVLKKDINENKLIDYDFIGTEVFKGEEDLVPKEEYIKKEFIGDYLILTMKDTYYGILKYIETLTKNLKSEENNTGEFDILLESMFTVYRKDKDSIYFMKIYLPKIYEKYLTLE